MVYESGNSIMSMTSYLCLILILYDVRECPVLRKYIEIYAKVFRKSHTLSATCFPMVWKICELCIHTYNMMNAYIGIKYDDYIYIYICMSCFMRLKEKLTYRIKYKQLVNWGKGHMRTSCPILAMFNESLKQQTWPQKRM